MRNFIIKINVTCLLPTMNHVTHKTHIGEERYESES